MAGGHSRLSPSSAHRWLECPGSVRLSDLVEHDYASESPYAAEGTKAHTIAEIEASKAFGIIDEATYQTRFLLWRDSVPVEQRDDMLRHAAEYVELLQTFMTEGHVQVMLEQKVNPGVPGSGGTADAVLLAPGRIHVVDYKYGRGIQIDAEDNPQLMLYGLGALEMFDGVMDEIETVCMTIHQPRLGGVSHSCVSAKDLRQWRDSYVKVQAALALGPDGYLSPSEKACRFCPAAGECTARAKYLTQRDFGTPELMSPVQMSEYLDLVDDLEAWCRTLRDAALHRAYNDQVEIPGYKVVRAGGRRSIPGAEEAIEVLADAGYTQALTVRQSLRPLGELERLVGGKKSLHTILGSMIVLSEGKESLVPEGDSRPSINASIDASADFSPKTDEDE